MRARAACRSSTSREGLRRRRRPEPVRRDHRHRRRRVRELRRQHLPEVAGPVFKQFKAGYEESAKQATGDKDQSLASLGIDPRRWRRRQQRGRVEGRRHRRDRRDRPGTSTCRSCSTTSTPRAGEDPRARRPGLRADPRQAHRGGEAPDRRGYRRPQRRDLHRRRRPRRAASSSRSASASPRARRSPQRSRRHPVRDFQLLDVNEDQEIEAPDDAKPFAELLAQIEGLGAGLDLETLRRVRRCGRRQPAGRRGVLEVRAAGGQRQREGPQVRGSPDDPVAADSSHNPLP